MNARVFSAPTGMTIAGNAAIAQHRDRRANK
jgi:hypothetical protein